MAKRRKGKAYSFFVLALTVLLVTQCGSAAIENQKKNTLSPCFAPVTAGDMLIAGGIPFGIRMQTKGVVVVAVGEVWNGTKSRSPASEAGVKKGDIIVSVGGKEVKSASDFCASLADSDGREVTLILERGGREKAVKVIPEPDKAGSYKLGLWIKDSAAGIGTVTFIDPKTGSFGGLGHGICDPETGELLPLASGTAETVELIGVTPGQAGVPGELRGRFSGKVLGTLTENRETGIFGVFSSVPEEISEALFPVGSLSEVHEGKAYLIATVGEAGRRFYEIELTAIDKTATQKNFSLSVCDEALLSETGGIVQGMSGSPIIQDGKLIGAVTHVMISDPSRGYGIFIENMLSSDASALIAA